MPQYRVYTYDLWGNENDGYEVNDVYQQQQLLEIADNATDNEIKALLLKECFSAGSTSEKITIEGEDTLYIEYDGKPVAELRKDQTT